MTTTIWIALSALIGAAIGAALCGLVLSVVQRRKVAVVHPRQKGLLNEEVVETRRSTVSLIGLGLLLVITSIAIPEGSVSGPRWTAENRQFMDRAKPAISQAAETSGFYFVAPSVRKSVCTFVRQLRGPHLSTWA